MLSKSQENHGWKRSSRNDSRSINTSDRQKEPKHRWFRKFERDEKNTCSNNYVISCIDRSKLSLPPLACFDRSRFLQLFYLYRGKFLRAAKQDRYLNKMTRLRVSKEYLYSSNDWALSSLSVRYKNDWNKKHTCAQSEIRSPFQSDVTAANGSGYLEFRLFG